MSKFKVGDKVIPMRKSIGCRHDRNWDEAQARGQKFMYVIRIMRAYEVTDDGGNEGDVGYSINMIKGDISGNHYIESDLMLYMNYTEETTLEDFIEKYS